MIAYDLPLDVLSFVNSEHKSNFQRVFRRFPTRNAEYAAAAYIAAVPKIFRCFSLEQQEDGPLDWFFEARDSTDPINRGVRAEALTGQTEALVLLAINLWNKAEGLNLAYGLAIWDDELFNVALQAIRIRRNYAHYTLR